MKSLPFPVFLFVAALVSAQPAAPSLPEDPGELLGLTPTQVLERFGAPARVFPVRGPEAWQDDVVFDYDGGFSLFLCLDRVWQVRLARPYAATVLGFSLGSDASRALSVFGVPTLQAEGVLEWILPGSAWPVRLRGLGDPSGSITELFIYRADF